MKGVEQYVEVARELGVDLTKGYLFRPTTSNNGVQDSPFSSSAADARLKVHLKQMKADDGETLQTGADLLRSWNTWVGLGGIPPYITFSWPRF